MSDSLLDEALDAVRQALTPLTEALASPEKFDALLRRFGWSLGDGARPEDLEAAFGAVAARLRTLATASSDDLPALVPGTTRDLVNLAQVADSALYPFDQPEFWAKPADQTAPDESFPRQVFDLLVFQYLQEHQPGLHGILSMIGVLRTDEMPERALQDAQAAPRARYIRCSVDWSRLPKYVNDPARAFAEVYSWNDPAKPFEHARFIENLGALGRFLPVPSSVDDLDDGLRALYYDYDGVNDIPKGMRQLTILPLLPADGDGVDPPVKLSLVAMPVPSAGARSGSAVGFALMPVVTGQLAGSFSFSEAVKLALSGDLTFVPVEVEVRPGGVKLSAMTLAALASRTDIKASALVTAAFPADAPLVVLGAAGGSRIEVSKAHLGFTVQGKPTDLEYILDAGADEAKLVIDFSKCDDGFLKSAFGSAPREFAIPLGLTWSSKRGLQLCGQAALAANVPLGLNLLDVVFIESLSLSATAGPDGNSTAVQAGIAGALTLGPVLAKVEGLGVQLVVKTGQAGRGNLGDLNLDFAFKPPTGIGLTVDSGAVTGGGALTAAADGRYTGALQLKVYSVSIAAVGVLETKLPGGEEGFSLLLIVCAEFAPVQLGLGFTLNGVGGLAGINRRVVTEEIQKDVRQGTVDHLLFPKDPVKSSAAILAGLQTVFPPAKGRYVFGPMALIDWGTPTMVEAKVGVMLEVPEPVRLLILGQVSAYFPQKPVDAASPKCVAELHLDVLGVVDFGRKTLAIDSTLHDSKIAGFAAFGDLALRMTWSDPPDFALAVGGFHPRYAAPPGFPALRRFTLALGAGTNPRITLQAYTAVTSNTLQVGALAELSASVGDFSLNGHAGFDALFILSPFSFQADLSASLALRYGSQNLGAVYVAAALSGPTPWHVRGSASISVLFFDVAVAFDARFGEEGAADPPAADPWPSLKKELEDSLGAKENWSPFAPLSAPVVLRAVRGAGARVFADPSGGLSFSQKTAPLEFTITRYKQAALAEPATVTVKSFTLNGSAAQARADAREFFPAAQFSSGLSDAQKLSLPSFEKLDSGAAVEPGLGFRTGLNSPLVYQTIVIAGEGGGDYLLDGSKQDAMTRRGAAARSPAASRGLRAFAAGKPAAAALGESTYVVASAEDLAPRGDITPPTTKTRAAQRLAQHLAAHPEERGKLQVLASAEVPE